MKMRLENGEQTVVGIGPCPASEPWPDFQSHDYPRKARIMCAAYLQQLKRMYPDGEFKIWRTLQNGRMHYTVVAVIGKSAAADEAAFNAEAIAGANAEAWDEEARIFLSNAGINVD